MASTVLQVANLQAPNLTSVHHAQMWRRRPNASAASPATVARGFPPQWSTQLQALPMLKHIFTSIAPSPVRLVVASPAKGIYHWIRSRGHQQMVWFLFTSLIPCAIARTQKPIEWASGCFPGAPMQMPRINPVPKFSLKILWCLFLLTVCVLLVSLMCQDVEADAYISTTSQGLIAPFRKGGGECQNCPSLVFSFRVGGLDWRAIFIGC